MPKYLGIIGCPIGHSLSPVMHNKALKYQNLDYQYLPFEVKKKDLGDALRALKALNFIGFNVTIPHKVSIIPYLDEISKNAELIGAVNTVHIKNGKLIGYNTDGIGFIRSLIEDGGTSPKKKRIMIFGAGGASRAIAVQLGLEGVSKVTIVNRTVQKAEILAKELKKKIPQVIYRGIGFGAEGFRKELQGVDIIVNATPVGMKPLYEKIGHSSEKVEPGVRGTEQYSSAFGSAPPEMGSRSLVMESPSGMELRPLKTGSNLSGREFSGLETLPIREEWLNSHQLVIDLVYIPRMTSLLKTARKAGCRILTGEGMLLYQGVEAYRIWTGIEPPLNLMREVLLEKLEQKNI